MPLPSPEQLNNNENSLLLETVRALQKRIAQLERRVGAKTNFANAAGVNVIVGTGDPFNIEDLFTGTAILFPPYSHTSGNYHIFGMNAGVLQWGASADDGQLYTGAGGIILNSTGIVFENASGILHFKNAAGVANMRIVANSGDDFVFQQENVGQPISWTVYHTDAATPSVHWQEDPANVNVSQFNVEKGTDGGKINIGSGLVLWASKDGTTTVFNDDSFDIDVRIEGATNPEVFKLDADLDTLTSLVWDGWGRDFATWTRTGDHTYTKAGDHTVTHRKGAKVRYKQGGGYEYGVIASSVFGAVTTITLITNTDYAMAAATITDTFISYIENPEGFPHWFNWDANPQGFSAVPTDEFYRWNTNGTALTFIYCDGTNGTSNATTFTATAPVAPVGTYATPLGTTVDNTVLKTTPGRITLAAGSTTITFRSDMANAAWTASGGKRAIGIAVYQF